MPAKVQHEDKFYPTQVCFHQKGDFTEISMERFVLGADWNAQE